MARKVGNKDEGQRPTVGEEPAPATPLAPELAAAAARYIASHIAQRGLLEATDPKGHRLARELAIAGRVEEEIAAVLEPYTAEGWERRRPRLRR